MSAKRPNAMDQSDPDVPLSQPEYEVSTHFAEVFSGRLDLDPDVIYERLEDRIVLVHLRSNRIFELSSSASRFCELLISGYTPAACLKFLAQEFDTNSEALCYEVQHLLETLSQEEIVRRC